MDPRKDTPKNKLCRTYSPPAALPKFPQGRLVNHQAAEVKPVEGNQSKTCDDWTLLAELPQFFQNRFTNICKHCHCKSNLVWRNFVRPEQHFDACFRYIENKQDDHKRCFVKRELLSREEEALLMFRSTRPQGSLSGRKWPSDNILNGPSY
jgi:hypothetical protein